MAVSSLLSDIETFLKSSGMAESSLGRGAINDWKLVAQLREGRRLWPTTEAKVRAFMASVASGAVSDDLSGHKHGAGDSGNARLAASGKADHVSAGGVA